MFLQLKGIFLQSLKIIAFEGGVVFFPPIDRMLMRDCDFLISVNYCVAGSTKNNNFNFDIG